VERWYAEGMPRRHDVQGDPAYGDTVRGPATPIGPGARVCPDVLEAAGLDKPALQVPVELYLSPPYEEEVLEEHGERLRVRNSMGNEKYITRQKDSIPHFVSWPVQNRDDFERLDPGSARFLMGEVALLMGFLDQPELVHRNMDNLAGFWASLCSRALPEVRVDALYIWEDMSYKNGG